MSDFYSPDRWLWPFELDGDNNRVEIVEDPGGGSEARLNVELTLSSNLSSSVNETYYAFGDSDPTGSDAADPLNVISSSSGTPTLQAYPLYDEIAKKLSDESAANGNSLNYECTASTPTNSDLTNSGITVQHDGALDFAFDFSSASDYLDPRFLGFDRDGQDASGTQQDGTTSGLTGTSIASPFSRWGMWQSPHAAHDKRRREEYGRFLSVPQQPSQSRSWRWTRGRTIRPITYQHVAGVHLWARDRADRQSAADRGGLPKGDHNNAFIDLWDRIQSGFNRAVIEHNKGTSGLTMVDEIEVATITGEGSNQFAPQQSTDRQYAGEQYDFTIEIAVPPPSDYNTSVNDISTVYRH